MNSRFITLLFFLLVLCFSERELVIRLKDLRFKHQLLTFSTIQSGIRLIPYIDNDSLEANLEFPSAKNLARYFLVESEDSELDSLREQFSNLPFVDAAYIKPIPEDPVIKETIAQIIGPKQNQTPLFESKQIYLGKPPSGIGVDAVRSISGGDGKNVIVYDVEQGWDFLHEDLLVNPGKVVVGPDIGAWDHGNAVHGEISGNKNNFGIIGIAPMSTMHGASWRSDSHPRVGPTLTKTANLAKKGDLMLLEMHAIGPRGRYINMEWWPDNFLAVKFAVEKGIIVLGAGGNGNEDLDHPDYNKPGIGFPPDWKNPFNRSLADSGGIIVGAGNPPPGTNGADHGPDRSRCDFSNYGSAVDSQGWGYEVTTTGYGDLQRYTNRKYTSRFSGTSSASPIVTGAITTLQGILKEKNLPLLDSWKARQILRKTGSPQTDAPGRPKTQRIGNRPDLYQLIKEIQNIYSVNLS